MESIPVTIQKSSFLRISPTWSNSGQMGRCSCIHVYLFHVWCCSVLPAIQHWVLTVE